MVEIITTKRIAAALLVSASLLLPSMALAASSNDAAPADIYERAQVISVSSAPDTSTSPDTNTEEGQPGLTAIVKMISGSDKDKQLTVQYDPGIAGDLKPGDTVVIDKPGGNAEGAYITDPYRINRLGFYILLFFAVAVYFGKRRGVFAVLGLIVSILIIFYYLVPKIIAGGSPFVVSLVAALLITIISLFVAHGFTKRTAIAFAGTSISLLLAIAFDMLLVYTTKLVGRGSEEAAYLQFGSTPVDFRGILLAGILIGVLGILDDITTAQAAVVEEIHHANPALTFKDLYTRGLSVGREHIASLINTLVLAYVGVSLPAILLMVSSKGSLWVVMNSSFMAEEIVRTLVGSLVLVIAVPLTTFLAAYIYNRSAERSQ